MIDRKTLSRLSRRHLVVEEVNAPLQWRGDENRRSRYYLRNSICESIVKLVISREEARHTGIVLSRGNLEGSFG
jgi:hypothetical protein